MKRGPAVVIHGGAGRALSDGAREDAVRKALEEVVECLWSLVEEGATAREVVVKGCQALEDCEHFNAGLGSAIQEDGQVRMSASVMDGERRSFSGVINVEEVQNPIVMADFLQEARDRVLAGRGAQRLARELRLPLFDPRVERRLREWVRRLPGAEERLREQAEVSPGEERDDRGSGTIGVVVCDLRGVVSAGTSTGGRGFERNGRVSDSATVAGNYAGEGAAVSCTGIGEDITDEALAAKIVIRVEDGMSLKEAMERSIEEAGGRGRRLAAIAVGRNGEVAWGKSTELLLAVARSPAGREWAF